MEIFFLNLIHKCLFNLAFLFLNENFTHILFNKMYVFKQKIFLTLFVEISKTQL